MAKPTTRFPTKADVLARTPDPGVREMLKHLERIGIETPFDRFDQQKPHCAFGLEGTCCKVREPDLDRQRDGRGFRKILGHPTRSSKDCAVATGRLQAARGFCDDTE